MSDRPSNLGSWFRFRLRALIFAVALVAILIVAGRCFYDWYTSTPLVESVIAFNSSVSAHSVGMHEPPIIEDEIVSAIESQLPTLDATDQVKAIYSRILRVRGASIDSTPGYSPAAGEHYTVWWINLNVMIGPTSGYGLRIRETDNPVAADDSKPLRR